MNTAFSYKRRMFVSGVLRTEMNLDKQFMVQALNPNPLLGTEGVGLHVWAAPVAEGAVDELLRVARKNRFGKRLVYAEVHYNIDDQVIGLKPLKNIQLETV